MRKELDIICKNFIINRDVIKETLTRENRDMIPIGALIFTSKGIHADEITLLTCKQILKKNTGLFSNFKGFSRLPVISMLATSRDPEEQLNKALEIYGEFKRNFSGSEYLVLCAIMLADLSEIQNYFNLSNKAKVIYSLMKQNHPILTSHDDSVFSMIFALSNKTNEENLIESEKCYNLIKSHFFNKDAVQSLSHVLALCDDSAEIKTDKVMEIYNKLLDKKYKYGKGYELASLGVLAMLPVHVDVIINDLIYVDSFLSKQKGYGFFSVSKTERLMHSAMIVASHHVDKKDADMLTSTIHSSIFPLIIAQQAAVMAAAQVGAAAS